MLYTDKIFLQGIIQGMPMVAPIGSGILPTKDVDGWKLMWDVLSPSKGLAPFVAVNGEAPLTDRDKIDTLMAEIVDIREKDIFTQEDILKFRQAGEPNIEPSGGGAATARRIADGLVNDKMRRLRSRIDARKEWMTWQALTTGKVTFTSDADAKSKVRFDVDYGVPSDQKVVLTSTAMWSDLANSDPLANITTWYELQSNACGRTPSVAYVGNKIPALLANNTKIRDLFKYSDVSSVITPVQVLDKLGQLFNMQFIRYNGSYTAGGSSAKFLSDYQMVMLPNPTSQGDGEVLGNMCSGPDMHNDFNTGIYVWTEEKNDPKSVEVGAGEHAFPVIYHPDWIFTATVAS